MCNERQFVKKLLALCAMLQIVNMQAAEITIPEPMERRLEPISQDKISLIKTVIQPGKTTVEDLLLNLGSIKRQIDEEDVRIIAWAATRDWGYRADITRGFAKLCSK